MIDRAGSSDPFVRHLLSQHPRVGRVTEGSHPGVDYEIGPWKRQVLIDEHEPLRGLIEMMDNNPLVCADTMSVPPAAGVLALIAFGPLADAGILAEPPSLILSFDADGDNVADWLSTVDWCDGLRVMVEPQDLGSVLAATAMAVIATPADWDDIDALYEERFGRSFYVRRDEDSVWAPSLVEGKPICLYRLRYTLGEANSLLTISLLADRNGKCGAGQVVHAMNVMSNFEETLGINLDE